MAGTYVTPVLGVCYEVYDDDSGHLLCLGPHGPPQSVTVIAEGATLTVPTASGRAVTLTGPQAVALDSQGVLAVQLRPAWRATTT